MPERCRLCHEPARLAGGWYCTDCLAWVSAYWPCVALPAPERVRYVPLQAGHTLWLGLPQWDCRWITWEHTTAACGEAPDGPQPA